jgi:hypothetical protein
MAAIVAKQKGTVQKQSEDETAIRETLGPVDTFLRAFDLPSWMTGDYAVPGEKSTGPATEIAETLGFINETQTATNEAFLSEMKSIMGEFKAELARKAASEGATTTAVQEQTVAVVNAIRGQATPSLARPKAQAG